MSEDSIFDKSTQAFDLSGSSICDAETQIYELDAEAEVKMSEIEQCSTSSSDGNDEEQTQLLIVKSSPVRGKLRGENDEAATQALIVKHNSVQTSLEEEGGLCSSNDGSEIATQLLIIPKTSLQEDVLDSGEQIHSVDANDIATQPLILNPASIQDKFDNKDNEGGFNTSSDSNGIATQLLVINPVSFQEELFVDENSIATYPNSEHSSDEATQVLIIDPASVQDESRDLFETSRDDSDCTPPVSPLLINDGNSNDQSLMVQSHKPSKPKDNWKALYHQDEESRSSPELLNDSSSSEQETQVVLSQSPVFPTDDSFVPETQPDSSPAKHQLERDGFVLCRRDPYDVRNRNLDNQSSHSNVPKANAQDDDRLEEQPESPIFCFNDESPMPDSQPIITSSAEHNLEGTVTVNNEYRDPALEDDRETQPCSPTSSTNFDCDSPVLSFHDSRPFIDETREDTDSDVESSPLKKRKIIRRSEQSEQSQDIHQRTSTPENYSSELRRYAQDAAEAGCDTDDSNFELTFASHYSVTPLAAHVSSAKEDFAGFCTNEREEPAERLREIHLVIHKEESDRISLELGDEKIPKSLEAPEALVTRDAGHVPENIKTEPKSVTLVTEPEQGSVAPAVEIRRSNRRLMRNSRLNSDQLDQTDKEPSVAETRSRKCSNALPGEDIAVQQDRISQPSLTIASKIELPKKRGRRKGPVYSSANIVVQQDEVLPTPSLQSAVTTQRISTRRRKGPLSNLTCNTSIVRQCEIQPATRTPYSTDRQAVASVAVKSSPISSTNVHTDTASTTTTKPSAPSLPASPTRENVAVESFKPPAIIGRGRKRAGVKVKEELIEGASEAETSISKSQRRTRSSDNNNESRVGPEEPLRRPRRTLAGQVRVLFTGMEDDSHCSEIVTSLGGRVVETASDCSLLVTDRIRRTVKFLCTVGRGLPIVTPDWLTKSKASGKFIDPWQHLLVDKDGEKRWNFQLAESLRKAGESRLLEGYALHATPGVKPPSNEMKDIVVACGGIYKEDLDDSVSAPSTIVISSKEEKSAWKTWKTRNRGGVVVQAEAILSGVLQQSFKPNQFTIT